MALMDTFVKSIKKEKREQMMIKMMPFMMEGLDINDLMPKMMVEMFKDVTVDDVVEYLKDTLNDNEKLNEFAKKIAEANLMSKMMMKKYSSKLNFEETVESLKENAPKNNWHIPDVRDLSKLWKESSIENPPKIKILYFCNAQGGFKITEDDELKPMTVMMPMGVSVYETSTGNVEIAAMNIGMMGNMFGGETRKVLLSSAENFENTVKDIVE